MQPTIGRIVHYTLTAADAEAINRRRADYDAFRRTASHDTQGASGRNGHQGHFGNHAYEGDQYPAVVIRVHDEPTVTVNLKVLLDGNDEYWATSVKEGDGSGSWSWPPRV